MTPPVQAILVTGDEGYLVRLSARVSDGPPEFRITGWHGNGAIEIRDRVRAAICNSGEIWPHRQIVVDTPPPILVRRTRALDVAIAVAILTAAGSVPIDALDRTAVLGELGLDGRLRPISDTFMTSAFADAAGIRQLLLPPQNMAEALIVPGIHVRGVTRLADLLDFLRGTADRTIIGRRGPEPDTTTT